MSTAGHKEEQPAAFAVRGSRQAEVYLSNLHFFIFHQHASMRPKSMQKSKFGCWLAGMAATASPRFWLRSTDIWENPFQSLKKIPYRFTWL
jgi:hypothetical protein